MVGDLIGVSLHLGSQIHEPVVETQEIVEAVRVRRR